MKFDMYNANFDIVQNIVRTRLGLMIDQEETELSIDKLEEILGEILIYTHGGEVDIDETIDGNSEIISRYITNSKEEEEIKLELENKRDKMVNRMSDEKLDLIKQTYMYLYNLDGIELDDLQEKYDEVRINNPRFRFYLEIRFQDEN